MTTNANEAGSLQDKWPAHDGQGPEGMDPLGNEHGSGDTEVLHGQDSNNADYAHSTGEDGGNQSTSSYREKQIKPNKVYIGGLPEHTRKEDLESCFGKIGRISHIELKVGYGFVEFDNREAAEESVAKYHEGFFMGNKIRVELSHGGGRTAKYNGEPGACFKCGQLGHWARECPNHGGSVPGGRRHDAPLIDRIQPSREYPPRDYPPYRDEYSRYPPPRDARYYDYPPPGGRDFRRATPPRDYPPGPPLRRDYDDYSRVRGPPPARFDARSGYYAPDDGPSPYPPRYGPPPSREPYDRRPPPPDRYPPGPPRGRDDFDRPPARDFPPAADIRGRPPSPRYDYPPRTGSAEGPGPRFRRRSQSPPPRSTSAAYDPAYPSGASGPPYSGGFAGSNGYSGPPRNAGSTRDYPIRPPREAVDSYRR